MLLVLYKYNHKTLPPIFDSFFTHNNEIHSHNTRQSLHMHVPLQTTVRNRQCLRNSGVSIYNYFVTRLIFDTSVSTFEKHVKTYLLENDLSGLV